METNAPYGSYNLTNSGEPMTWASIARAVFQARGRDAASVSGVTTTEYAAGKSLAPRPRHSMLSLDKIISSGFQPADASSELQAYLSRMDEREK
jgi:dTDP-4-dehydrorhamnose 3,5-epimerase/reductase